MVEKLQMDSTGETAENVDPDQTRRYVLATLISLLS